MTDTPTPGIGASALIGDTDLSTPRPATRQEAYARLGEMMSQPRYIKPQTEADVREIAAAREAASAFDRVQIGPGMSVDPVAIGVAQAEHEMARATVERDAMINKIASTYRWPAEAVAEYRAGTPISPERYAAAKETVALYRDHPYYRGLLAKRDPTAETLNSIANAMLTMRVAEPAK